MPTNLPSAPVGWVIVAVACQVAFVVLAVLTVRIDRAAKTRPLRVKSSHGESEAGFYQRMATDSRVLGHQWAKLGQSDLADMHERIAVTYQQLVEAAQNGDDPPTAKPAVRQCIVCNVDSTKQLFWWNDTLCLACGANAEADKVEAENAGQKARNAALKERLADNKRRVAEQCNGRIDQARSSTSARTTCLSKSVPVIQGPVCGQECSCHWSAEKHAEMKNRDADV